MSGNAFYFQWEADLIRWLQSRVGGVSIFSLFSAFGEEVFMLLAMGFLYWCWDKKAGQRAGLAIVAAAAWGTMIKAAAMRLRPYFVHEDVKLLRVMKPEADILDVQAQGYSFPSVHSINAVSMCASTAIIFRKRIITCLAVILPLLVGFSRVLVGAHYPTDVLAGWLMGFITAVLVNFLYERVKSKPLLFGCLLLTALPGLFLQRSADYYTSLGLLIGFMAAVLAEEKYVRFENTRNPIRWILRILGGGAVYLALNKLLKLPFSAAFLDSGDMPAMLVRCARYAIIGFVEFAVYPMAFKYTAAIGKQRDTAVSRSAGA